MNTVTCVKCNKSIASKDIIKTDEFKQSRSEVKNYCPLCFIAEVKNGFGNYKIGECSICKSPLVLQHDVEETVSLAQEDFTVHFVCNKIKNEINNSLGENSNHDELILYTIQPD
ncbi:hypothetical protein [Fictibacillus halophilus]|uniref:hypothetical protein n=1 Tax=Fictibacillus halophilus TaxID=1610490 RepID=UPI001CFA33AA|nr:hypothetical protein [Fictibacillus halophilus]